MGPEARATSVQGSMRHTFARPDQASIGYLFRLKMVFTEMPQPLRILRVPSTATFHQFHLVSVPLNTLVCHTRRISSGWVPVVYGSGACVPRGGSQRRALH